MLRTFKLSSFRYASFTAYKIALLEHASQQCYNILELASQQFRDVQEGNSCFLKYASCKLANFYDMQVLLLEIGKIAHLVCKFTVCKLSNFTHKKVSKILHLLRCVRWTILPLSEMSNLANIASLEICKIALLASFFR